MASTPTLHVDLPVPTFLFSGAPLQPAENYGSIRQTRRSQLFIGV
jgi:hypothetical protein